MSDYIPCRESFWLRDSMLDYIRKSSSYVSRDELHKMFPDVDESLVTNELKCLEAGGSIRMLYDDLTCVFVIA